MKKGYIALNCKTQKKINEIIKDDDQLKEKLMAILLIDKEDIDDDIISSDSEEEDPCHSLNLISKKNNYINVISKDRQKAVFELIE